MTIASQLQRLSGQFECLTTLLEHADEGVICEHPSAGTWSVHDIAAHLGRYHEIFRERLDRILREQAPRFEPYRAEEDAGWAVWPALSTDEVLQRLREQRAGLTQVLEELTAGQRKRTGVHRRLGEMAVQQWVEFFLLHEAHHLYTVLFRVTRAR